MIKIEKNDNDLLAESLDHIITIVDTDAFTLVPIEYFAMALDKYKEMIDRGVDSEIAGASIEALNTKIAYNANVDCIIVEKYDTLIKQYEGLQLLFTMTGGKRVSPNSKIILEYTEGKITRDDALEQFKKLITKKVKAKFKKNLAVYLTSVIEGTAKTSVWLDTEKVKTSSSISNLIEKIENNRWGTHWSQKEINYPMAISMKAKDITMENLRTILDEMGLLNIRHISNIDLEYLRNELYKVFGYEIYAESFNNYFTREYLETVINPDDFEMTFGKTFTNPYKREDLPQAYYRRQRYDVLFSLKVLGDAGLVEKLDFTKLIKQHKDNLVTYDSLVKDFNSATTDILTAIISKNFAQIQGLSDSKTFSAKSAIFEYIENH